MTTSARVLHSVPCLRTIELRVQTRRAGCAVERTAPLAKLFRVTPPALLRRERRLRRCERDRWRALCRERLSPDRGVAAGAWPDRGVEWRVAIARDVCF